MSQQLQMDDVFRKQIEQEPNNRMHWMAYADWFGEQGDFRQNLINHWLDNRNVIASVVTTSGSANSSPTELKEWIEWTGFACIFNGRMLNRTPRISTTERKVTYEMERQRDR